MARSREIELLGAGRAGTALATALGAAGWRIGTVVARTEESARRAVTELGARHASTRPGDALQPGAVTLFALPEGLLAATTSELAAGPPLPGAIALHLSGSLAAEVLAPLRTRGVAIGSLHPLASFADRGHPPGRLAGVTFDLDGDPAACAVAQELVASLEGRAVELTAEGKPLFHAAACVASNAFVALFDLACRLGEAAGATPASVQTALATLAASTLGNLARLGSPAALTGPIERGEVEVIARHLEALARRAPGDAELYRELARATVAVARRKGTLPAETAARFETLLAKPRN